MTIQHRHSSSRVRPDASTVLTVVGSAAAGAIVWACIAPLAFAQTGASMQPDDVEPIFDDPIEPRRVIDIEVQMATAPDLPTYIYRLWSDGAIEMASSAYPPDRFTEWKPLPED